MEDTLRLLLGNLPKARTGPPNSLISNGIPVSQHYARLLSDLAYERGFDGYLLNFEFPFPGRSEEARAVEAWISLLNHELKRKVGEYAQIIWLSPFTPSQYLYIANNSLGTIVSLPLATCAGKTV